jgi:hypothetical protein
MFFRATIDRPITGIFIPLSPDEAINITQALTLRSSGLLPPSLTISNVADSYTRFELALIELDASLQTVPRGTDNRDTDRNGGAQH